MKNKTIRRILKSWQIGLIVIVCFGPFLGSSLVRAEPSIITGQWDDVPVEQYQAVLEDMLGKVAANQNQIKTWQGVCQRTRTNYYYDRSFQSQEPAMQHLLKEDTVSRELKERCEFIVDCAGNRVYSHIHRPDFYSYRTLPSGEEFIPEGITLTTAVKAILTPSESWSYLYDEAAPTLAIPISPAERRSGSSPAAKGWEYDPRDAYYGNREYDYSLETALKSYIKDVQDSQGHFNLIGGRPRFILQKEQTGGHTRYRILSRAYLNGEKDKITETETVFDGQYGYQVVSTTSTIPSSGSKGSTSREYKVIDGVVVLAMAFRSWMEDGRIVYEIKEVIETTSINQAIAEDTFSWHKLGLEQGVKILDYIEKAEFALDQGQLVKVKDRPELAQ